MAEQWPETDLPHVQERSALWTADQRTHAYDVSHGITHAITVATDHLHAMRMALTGAAPGHIGLHAHTPFTLLRAALENTCTALWLTGAPGRPERILRRLRLEAKSLRHNEQLLRLRGADGTADIAARRDRLDAVADARGITAATLHAQLSPTGILKTVGQQLCPDPDEAGGRRPGVCVP